MAFSRDTTLRKAEKLLRQGRLDAAVAEYLRVIEDQPRDWNTANVLGDLYVRAGQRDKAVEQYTRIADHLSTEGFYSKASAVYKKILKIKSDDEHALLQLAEITARQGLMADAKSALKNVAESRRARGDKRGAAEIRMRLGTLDPSDLDARMTGARAAVEIGELPVALAEFKAIAEELQERQRGEDAVKLLGEIAELSPEDPDVAASLMRAYVARGDFTRARAYARTPAQFKDIAANLQARSQAAEALEALAEASALDPADIETKVQLARSYLSLGNLPRARQYLSREVAGSDTDLLWTLAELELRGDRPDDGLAILEQVLRGHPDRRGQLVLLGCSVADVSVDTAYRVIDLSASAAIDKGEWADAAAALNEFVNREPGHIPALMKLVEICVDGGLEATMYSAQGQLADAYLANGRGGEARVIAEDLVAREPWDRVNIERFRRALTLLGEKDIDQIIADRLSGQTPFVSTDLFPAFEEQEAGPMPVAPPAVSPVPARPLAPERGVEPAGVGIPGRAAAPDDESEVFELGANAIDIGFLTDGERDGARVRPASEASEVDLSSALQDMQSGAVGAGTDAERPDAPDLDGVFKGFRADASREHPMEVALQHHKLALTYLDMNMVDEAVKALEVAVRAPRLRFEAASMLARIHLKQDAPAQAIEWFERAAEAPAPSPDEGRELLYDLADALESQGETARALAVFLELQADAGEYRDLQVRLQRLTKVQMQG